MKTVFGIIFLLVAGLTITSCQREIDGMIITPDPSPLSDSTVLSKFIEIDTTKTIGSDTVMKFEYSYDNTKRLSKINFTETYSITGGTRTYTVATTWHYNGADTLPFKVTKLINDVDIDTDTSFYVYQNGYVVYDSTIHYNNNVLDIVTIVNYTNSGNNSFVTTRTLRYSSSGISEERTSGTVFKNYSGKNIIYQRDTTSDLNKVTNATVVENTVDTHINPMYFTELHFPVFNGFGSATISQPNNLTETKYQDLSGTTFSGYKYTHVYRADGYPVKTRVFDQNDPTENTQYIYIYTKL